MERTKLEGEEKLGLLESQLISAQSKLTELNEKRSLLVHKNTQWEEALEEENEFCTTKRNEQAEQNDVAIVKLVKDIAEYEEKIKMKTEKYERLETRANELMAESEAFQMEDMKKGKELARITARVIKYESSLRKLQEENQRLRADLTSKSVTMEEPENTQPVSALSKNYNRLKRTNSRAVSDDESLSPKRKSSRMNNKLVKEIDAGKVSDSGFRADDERTRGDTTEPVVCK